MKTFELESVTFTDGKTTKHNMVFSAFDESRQCFIKMVLEPRTIKTIKKGAVLKVIQGEITEIVRYV